MAQTGGLSSILLGDSQAIGQDNRVSIFGEAGSGEGGGSSRLAIGPGLALITGASYGRADYARSDVGDSFMGAAALRYVTTNKGVWHGFVQGGGWFQPNADLSFDRVYMNGAGTATGVGHSNGDLGYAAGRAGILFQPTAKQQIAVSGEIGREWMKVDGYLEPLSAANPFEAAISGGTDQMDVAKVRVQYSFSLSQKVDATVWGAAGFGFNETSGFTATVDGAGTYNPDTSGESQWAEYGARLGYAWTPKITLSAFMDGVAGNNGTGARTHGGAEMTYHF
jgi:hypothetical protein